MIVREQDTEVLYGIFNRKNVKKFLMLEIQELCL